MRAEWMGRPALLALALALATSGCFHRHHHDGASADEAYWSTADPQLLFEGLRVRRDGEVRRLRLDEPLYTGDELALDISTPEPTYLYVVNIAPGGSEHVAWPSVRPVRSVDGPDSWFKLSKPSGQELVALVATHRKIPLNGCGKKWLIKTVRREAERDGLTRVQSVKPPGVGEDGYATMGLRARTLAPEGSGFRVEGTPHYAVLLLDLDHRTR